MAFPDIPFAAFDAARQRLSGSTVAAAGCPAALENFAEGDCQEWHQSCFDICATTNVSR